MLVDLMMALPTCQEPFIYLRTSRALIGLIKPARKASRKVGLELSLGGGLVRARPPPTFPAVGCDSPSRTCQAKLSWAPIPRFGQVPATVILAIALVLEAN